jgi:hypothetical protein
LGLWPSVFDVEPEPTFKFRSKPKAKTNGSVIQMTPDKCQMMTNDFFDPNGARLVLDTRRGVCHNPPYQKITTNPKLRGEFLSSYV